mmetsp:Transcript_29041/g.73390  ORF Transcript_29041/g.73390 Transcript_29041/m.73390 type:complete len:264 (-) Transcript_29041:46-837(-)
MLLHGLLRLHLQAAAHSVKGVRGASTDSDGRLRRREGADGTQDALVLLVGVQARDGVEATQLQPTVAHDANHGHAEARVQGQEAAWALHRLHDAVAEAREALLARAHVGGEACPRIVQRVHNRQAARCSQAAGHQVRTKELRELRLRVVLREHPLEGVLEGQVEGLRGEVPDAIREVAIPEALHALLLVDAHAAVRDARVPGHLPAADLGVRILGLHHQLDALNRRRERLGHCSRDTTQDEVNGKVAHTSVLPHDVCTREASC